MRTVLHARLYGRFIEIQNNLWRNRLQRTNQGSNFFGSSFSNRENVRAPIQFRRERQPKHLKRWFFPKNRHNHFYINSTTGQWNKLSFTSIKINRSLLAPVQCLVVQIQIQQPYLWDTQLCYYKMPKI